VGIDLGTTNSLVGAVVDGSARLFADSSGAELLPSVVGTGTSGEAIVGRAARNQRLLDPDGTVASVKRRMGQDVKLRVGNSQLSPAQVSALILSSLVDRTEQELGARPTRAVITVPAFFDDAQRQATRDAGSLAGLQVERLVNEPTAAALNYQTGSEQTALVYDLGGGTFDISLLDLDEGLLEVQCSRGDTELGGDDIDAALVEHVLSTMGASRRSVEADLRAMTRLTEAVERAKIALSSRDEVRLFEPFLAGEGARATNLDLKLTRVDLERIVGPLVNRTLECIDDLLQEVDISAGQVDRVILVGGSSKMPLVQQRVREHLGRPVLCDADADRAVAIGASLLGGRAGGQAVQSVLVDITPHTLAAGAVDPSGLVTYDLAARPRTERLAAVPVIRRDTVVPVTKTQTVYTMYKDQPAAAIPIVQGEGQRVRDNTWLGEVCIENIPPGPAHSPVEVSFGLDLSGVLSVTATHLPSGKSAQVRIADSPYRLSEQRRAAERAEVEALLARASEVEDEQAALRGAEEPKPGNESRVAGGATEDELALARAMLARAEKAMQAHGEGTTMGERVEQVRGAWGALRAAVEDRSQDVGELTDRLSDRLLDLL
jgi:molecular chaperone DnaK